MTHFLKYKGSQSILGLLWPYTHARTNLKAVLQTLPVRGEVG